MADTAAKRYSAMNMMCPWRGLRVVPDVAIPQGERQAAMFMYSGLVSDGPPDATEVGSSQSHQNIRRRREMIWIPFVLVRALFSRLYIDDTRD